jgi:hypothetical protein
MNELMNELMKLEIFPSTIQVSGIADRSVPLIENENENEKKERKKKQ